jgi:hypothetical protein
VKTQTADRNARSAAASLDTHVTGWTCQLLLIPDVIDPSITPSTA